MAVLYFSYGANMSSAVLQKRIVKPLKATNAIATGMSISFCHRGGYATLVTNTHHSPCWKQPHGVLYEISREDYLKLQVRCVILSRPFYIIRSRMFQVNDDANSARKVKPYKMLGLITIRSSSVASCPLCPTCIQTC